MGALLQRRQAVPVVATGEEEVQHPQASGYTLPGQSKDLLTILETGMLSARHNQRPAMEETHGMMEKKHEIERCQLRANE